jgi:hypothetical protein
MKNWSGANMTSLSSQISAIPNSRNPVSSLGPILSLAVRCMQGCFGSQVSWTQTQSKPNLRVEWVSEWVSEWVRPVSLSSNPYYILVGQSVWLLCWEMHPTLCTNTRLAQIWCFIEQIVVWSRPQTNSCSWLILYNNLFLQNTNLSKKTPDAI